jgi:hypothetical protein
MSFCAHLEGDSPHIYCIEKLYRIKVEQNLNIISLMLRQTVSRPVFLGIKHPSGAYDQIFITVRHLRVS